MSGEINCWKRTVFSAQALWQTRPLERESSALSSALNVELGGIT